MMRISKEERIEVYAGVKAESVLCLLKPYLIKDQRI